MNESNQPPSAEPKSCPRICCKCGEPIVFYVELAQVSETLIYHDKCWRERDAERQRTRRAPQPETAPVPRLEACCKCGEKVADWVDTEASGGRICRKCEAIYFPEPAPESAETPETDKEWQETVELDPREAAVLLSEHAERLERRLSAALARVRVLEAEITETLTYLNESGN